MSRIDQSLRPVQPFFRSVPMQCPYLPDRLERKLFTRMESGDLSRLNSRLARAGFRRSHDVLYRPVCPGCRACLPVRIPVDRMTSSRSLTRVRRRNRDLILSVQPSEATREAFQLFEHYQAVRHGDSDMARMALTDFTAMLEEGAGDAFLLEARDGEGRLVGVLLADRLEDGFSAVYSFFDPGAVKRSLGTFLVLALTELALAEGLPQVYLGYWIKGSPKMDYKSRFSPLEALIDGRWQSLPATDVQPSGQLPAAASTDEDK